MTASVLKTGGKILTRATGDVGNSDTSYVYFVLGKEGMNASLEWANIAAITLSLEFSNEDLAAGLDPYAATAAQLNALHWADKTNDLLGAATTTANNNITFDSNWTWKLGRVKLVTTNATNSIDIYYSVK